MTALAEQLRSQHQDAAAAQIAMRSQRRVVRRTPMALTPQESTPEPDERLDTQKAAMPAPQATKPPSLNVVPIVPAETFTPPAIPSVPSVAQSPAPNSVSPLDQPAEAFRLNLERRRQNREALIAWLKQALVEGVDYGSVHIVGKERCPLAKQGRVSECRDPRHLSKNALFKSGAEVICSALGLTAAYPNLPAYEQAMLAQQDIRTIMLRCELRDAHGNVVAEGVGARSVAQDYGDVNRSLKMCTKSAMVDATLRAASISALFTQDLESIPTDDTFQGAALGTLPSSPATTPPPPKSVPRNPLATSNDLIGVQDLLTLRQAIADHDFDEQRVLNWLHKATKGQVARLEELPLPLLPTLFKKLDQWAQAEADMGLTPSHSPSHSPSHHRSHQHA